MKTVLKSHKYLITSYSRIVNFLNNSNNFEVLLYIFLNAQIEYFKFPYISSFGNRILSLYNILSNYRKQRGISTFILVSWTVNIERILFINK